MAKLSYPRKVATLRAGLTVMADHGGGVEDQESRHSEVAN